MLLRFKFGQLTGLLFLLAFVVLQPVVGALSDRLGRRPVLIAFGVVGTLGNVPLLMTLSHTQSPVVAGLLILCAAVAISCYTALGPAVKAELFPAEIRSIGVGLPSAISISIFGGTVGAIALAFKKGGHETWFYWYVTACIACSLLVFIFMRESSKHSRI